MKFSDIKALTFDCYGTLIDWETGLPAALKPWARGHAVTASADDLLAAFARHEARFEAERPAPLYRDVLARVLGAIGEDFGVATTAEECAAFGASIADWPPFPDSRAALARLKARFTLAVVSNADNRSFAASSAMLGDPFDLVVTAEDVGSYKPARAHFDRVIQSLGKRAIGKSHVLHVAQSLFHDIAPAKALGLKTCWVDRRAGRAGGATPKADAQPDLTVTSLEELADVAERAG